MTYDSVRRYMHGCLKRQSKLSAEVFIPLVFDPGEAYHFDCSHELVEMSGIPVKVKLAHLRSFF